MPRPPSSAARFGTRFHAWVEARFGQQDLFDPDDLPGPADAGHRRRRRPRRADRDASRRPVRRPGPARRSRRRSRSSSTARWCAAGSTRSTPRPTERLPRRRLEDQPRQTADPLQLALYRLAWAELAGVPLERGARGVLLRPQRGVVEPDDLPGRAEPARSWSGSAGGVSLAARARGARSRPCRPKVCSRSCDVVSSPVTMWSETVQIASARRPCLAASVYSALASISTASTP